ncbi:hypothetical protein [Candidatus Nitrospira inopinata]|jgi:hypothetical protein|uniref:Uncharacterized protein n=1 Tax=Candidatus Nitrospira inopinata TaxID=1715989 RepID=A0A0S4KT01_9BACT|nr:hypothetical protein [Candidatus Nitrospira inopinata]CUQ66312.1 conserved protein of unknown function [Candidatus Nitrospira inopinata]
MTLATLDSPQLSYGAAPTRGAGPEARFIAKQSEEGRRRLREAHSIGLGAERAFEELFVVARECETRNWDGHGATRVSAEAIAHACRLLSALPLGIPAPSVGAEPDGHVTFEWHRSPRWTLSVSISPEGDLHYAALLGSSKVYGTEPFFGETPSRILELIRQVSLL